MLQDTETCCLLPYSMSNLMHIYEAVMTLIQNILYLIKPVVDHCAMRDRYM